MTSVEKMGVDGPRNAQVLNVAWRAGEPMKNSRETMKRFRETVSSHFPPSLYPAARSFRAAATGHPGDGQHGEADRERREASPELTALFLRVCAYSEGGDERGGHVPLRRGAGGGWGCGSHV